MAIHRAAYSIVLAALISQLSISCAGMPDGASAEEYYSLGVAYFDLGKFAEAERWFLKAAKADKTRVASEYNLGRIAFEKGDAGKAAELFESVLVRDPDNIPALKAAAYSRIKTGDLEKARAHYDRIVVLVPDSQDATYNYALVLHALKDYEGAIAVLESVLKTKADDRDALLLLARSEKALSRPEAVDKFSEWLEDGDDAVVRRELAETCESIGLFARAVENYDAIISAGKSESAGVGKGAVRFAKARALLIAGEKTETGIEELRKAFADGFADEAAFEALLNDERIGGRPETAAAIRASRAPLAQNAEGGE